MADVAKTGLLVALILLGSARCTTADERARDEASAAAQTWIVPAADRGRACADVTDFRVCWTEDHASCGEGACVGARPVPAVRPLSRLGWRCSGDNANRRCIDRRNGTGRFVCQGGLCRQRHPRLPDDGEWTCSDDGGAVVCAGGDAPAGIAENVADPAFICGNRRRTKRNGAERVCVDFAPDFPDGSARGWRCRYSNEDGLQRICERDRTAHAIGDSCDAKRPCLDGLHCIASRCVPERPDPSCAFDRDCEAGRCKFGTCRRDEG